MVLSLGSLSFARKLIFWRSVLVGASTPGLSSKIAFSAFLAVLLYQNRELLLIDSLLFLCCALHCVLCFVFDWFS